MGTLFWYRPFDGALGEKAVAVKSENTILGGNFGMWRFLGGLSGWSFLGWTGDTYRYSTIVSGAPFA